ncbi:MAG: hypothetical protein KC733_06050 [Candidatus Omnitrophica bacterium]|nr:hypothetical protein [Candidatus Omnitrophota bacterium]
MKIIENNFCSIQEVKSMATSSFGDFVKAVVDIEKELLAIDAELHSDLESALLEAGSVQTNLWGINLYPDLTGDDFIEFDSMINLRPGQNNFSRGVDDMNIQKKIREVVKKRISG